MSANGSQLGTRTPWRCCTRLRVGRRATVCPEQSSRPLVHHRVRGNVPLAVASAGADTRFARRDHLPADRLLDQRGARWPAWAASTALSHCLGCSRERAPIARSTFATPEQGGVPERRRRRRRSTAFYGGPGGAALDRSATELERRDSVDSRSRLPPLDTPGCFGRRNCNVNLDDLRWDRPGVGCEPQQARGIPRNLQLDETDGVLFG